MGQPLLFCVLLNILTNVKLIAQSKPQVELKVELKHIINWEKAGRNEKTVRKERCC